jgi:hypothetical protein
MSLTIHDAAIRARNQSRDHFTISFHFLIFSSSPPEIVIMSPPYTIAPTASRARSPESCVVQYTILFLIPLSISPSPGLTRSDQERQLSSSALILPPLYSQAAKVMSPQKLRAPARKTHRSIIIFFMIFI